jgi:hypothetical protein
MICHAVVKRGHLHSQIFWSEISGRLGCVDVSTSFRHDKHALKNIKEFIKRCTNPAFFGSYAPKFPPPNNYQRSLIKYLYQINLGYYIL